MQGKWINTLGKLVFRHAQRDPLARVQVKYGDLLEDFQVGELLTRVGVGADVKVNVFEEVFVSGRSPAFF